MKRTSNEPPALQPTARAPAAIVDDFRKLMTLHAPYVWRVLRSMGVPHADLPDVCQETFLVVHRQLSGFEGRSSLRTWICGIALRVASDYRSKAYRRREKTMEDVPELLSSPAQHEAIERREDWQLIDALMAMLPEDQRQVFVLYEIEQMAMKDIAAMVDCPLSTAYSRLRAGREAVQGFLAARREKEASP